MHVLVVPYLCNGFENYIVRLLRHVQIRRWTHDKRTKIQMTDKCTLWQSIQTKLRIFVVFVVVADSNFIQFDVRTVYSVLYIDNEYIHTLYAHEISILCYFNRRRVSLLLRVSCRQFIFDSLVFVCFFVYYFVICCLWVDCMDFYIQQKWSSCNDVHRSRWRRR